MKRYHHVTKLVVMDFSVASQFQMVFQTRMIHFSSTLISRWTVRFTYRWPTGKMWKLQLLVWIVSTAKLFHKKDSLETELSIAQSISKHIDILAFNHVKFNVPQQQQSLNQLIKLSWLPLSKSARSEKIAKIVI